MNPGTKKPAARIIPMKMTSSPNPPSRVRSFGPIWSMETVAGYRPEPYDEIFVREICLRMFLIGRADTEPDMFVHENLAVPDVRTAGRRSS
jgi:hypothetical protein